MYLRRTEHDSDYYETSDTESELSTSDNESINDEDEIIGPDFLNKGDISLFQSREPELIRKAEESKLRVEFLQPENLAVVVEGGNQRIILPDPLRLTAFNNAHQILHLGIDKSILAVAKYFWWPTVSNDVEYWTRSCIECQVLTVRNAFVQHCCGIFGIPSIV